MVSTEYLASIHGIAQFINPLDLPKQLCYNQINRVRENKCMRKSTRSILQELSDLGVKRDTDLIIESRGSNIIESAVNLLVLIRENYDIETSAELERRFVNAIRSGDSAKFKRGIKKIQESKKP
jgi:hypothetical protein